VDGWQLRRHAFLTVNTSVLQQLFIQREQGHEMGANTTVVPGIRLYINLLHLSYN